MVSLIHQNAPCAEKLVRLAGKLNQNTMDYVGKHWIQIVMFQTWLNYNQVKALRDPVMTDNL